MEKCPCGEELTRPSEFRSGLCQKHRQKTGRRTSRFVFVMCSESTRGQKYQPRIKTA